MDQEASPRSTGCAPAFGITLLLVALAAIPAGVAAALPAAGVGLSGWTQLRVPLVAIVLLLLFALVAWLLRRSPAWRPTATLAAALAAVAGYLAVEGALLFLPPLDIALAALIRLVVLGVYLALAVAWVPLLAGLGQAGPLRILGLDSFRWPPFLLGLAAAALVTIPWAYTGSLGDRVTSAELALRALAQTWPEVLLFWGLAFFMLRDGFSHRLAALLTLLAFTAYVIGRQALWPDQFSVLQEAVTVLPAALLLTELRVRGAGVYPLLIPAWAVYALPLLLTDPRDLVTTGLPTPAHLFAYLAAAAIALALGFFLWIGRQVSSSRARQVGEPSLAPRGPSFAALAMAVLFLLSWGLVYALAGEPGFHDDGFLIILSEQADLSGAASITDPHARVDFVYRTLVETANRTQAPLRQELDGLHLPYRPYYIMNMIRVDGHHWSMGRFEGRPGVAQVLLNPNVRPYPHYISWLQVLASGTHVPAPTSLLPNLQAIHADQAWAQGVTGAGVVVAGQDTGVQWDNPALKAHYRGWDGQNATHDYNWHDAWDDTAVPFDPDVHGTHTMGTVLGDDGNGHRVGVAPGARWIACRNMRQGIGNPGAYAECSEFFLAPYPHGGNPFTDGNPALAPQVVNNSWGCPSTEGCQAGTLSPAMDSLRAAGIMMVVSAGNEGPNCGTATTPPANYASVLSVGAVTTTGTVLASFSSRGPVDSLVKPNVSAPGVAIVSCVPGGGYAPFDGTSSAGPHVAGSVALLWSANPALVGQIDATEQLICKTASPRPVDNACTAADVVPPGQLSALSHNPICACGGVTGVPNNLYGCGVIDAGAAVQAVKGGTQGP